MCYILGKKVKFSENQVLHKRKMLDVYGKKIYNLGEKL